MSEGRSWDPSVRVVHVMPPAPGSPFRCAVPQDWERLPLLSDEPDFSDPTTFMPLGAFMVDAGSMIVTIAGRPAYDSGSPAQWLPYLCRELGFEATASAPIPTSRHRAIASCHATQATSRGPMHMRLALYEDQGQWILLTAMAVAPRWESLERTFLDVVESFELLETTAPAASRAQAKTIIPFPVAARTSRHERYVVREPLRPSFRFATT